MDPYATHQQALVRTALKARAAILELGCGDYSTPILAEIAGHLGVPFVALTSNRDWGKRYEDIAEVVYVDWSDFHIPFHDVVLLDNEQRTDHRIRHLPALAAAGAKHVVVHDFVGCSRRSHWPEMRRHWRNMDVYDRYENQTGVLWN